MRANELRNLQVLTSLSISDDSVDPQGLTGNDLCPFLSETQASFSQEPMDGLSDRYRSVSRRGIREIALTVGITSQFVLHAKDYFGSLTRLVQNVPVQHQDLYTKLRSVCDLTTSLVYFSPRAGATSPANEHTE